jgi:hypothetical protein
MQLGDYIICSLGKDMIRIPAGKGQDPEPSVTLENNQQESGMSCLCGVFNVENLVDT